MHNLCCSNSLTGNIDIRFHVYFSVVKIRQTMFPVVLLLLFLILFKKNIFFLRGRRPPWKQVLPLLGLFFHLEFYFNHLPGQKNESETFEMICMNLLLIDELGAIFKSSNPKVLSYILVEKDIKRWPWNLDDNRTFNIITGAK